MIESKDLFNFQDLHPVRAAAIAIEITFGQDHPIAGLHQFPFPKFLNSCVAQVRGIVLGRRKRNGVYASEHGCPILRGGMRAIAIDRYA